VSDRRPERSRGGALPGEARGGRGRRRRQPAGAVPGQAALVYTWAQELIRHPKILDAVEDVIGPDILAWQSVFFTKDRRRRTTSAGTRTSPTGAFEAEGDVVTAWVALSPSTVQSGCMRVVPGTHRREVVPHADTFSERNMLSRGQEIAVEVDEAHAVDLVLQPGQMSLHHVKIFHGSHQNRAQHRRIGFAIRYLPPHIQVGADAATLVAARTASAISSWSPRPPTTWRRRRSPVTSGCATAAWRS
jgi:non-haem Fe2+, alpha-ketoglutarate-dependent halogenase